MSRLSYLMRAGILCAVFSVGAVAVAPVLAPVGAEDADQLQDAETLSERLNARRRKKEYAALAELVAGAPAMHNDTQDPKVRRRLQVVLGAILRDADAGSAHAPTIAALLCLDDSQGAWRQLKKHLPDKKTVALTDLQRHVLAGLREHPLDEAFGALKGLVRKARERTVRLAAAELLGAYGRSPRRPEAVRALLDELAWRRPPADASLLGAWMPAWREISHALVASLQELTGQATRDVPAWVREAQLKSLGIETLFDGRRKLSALPVSTELPWARMRAALGAPKKSTGKVVQRGLQWLAAHQAPDGGWRSDEFGLSCDGKAVPSATAAQDGAGKPYFAAGVSGLALCAFLSAGYTDRGKQPFAKVVARGLRYLMKVQDSEGCFGSRFAEQFVYNHAPCALAMVEAYGMTGRPAYKESALRAVAFILKARNPVSGWRYGVKPKDCDTSITACMMLALGCARMVSAAYERQLAPPPFEIPEAAYVGVRRWLDETTDPDYGRVGYVERGTGPSRPGGMADRFPSSMSEAMTAAGMTVRMLMGADPTKSKVLKLGRDLCAHLPPLWSPTSGGIDMYYWHYGALAMFQVGGMPWAHWQRALAVSIERKQRKDTAPCQYLGSWDPLGPWGADGGRVYSTAILLLTLLTPQRYPRWSK